MKISKSITQNSWFQGGSGGMVAGLCCILHAVAVVIGFSAGATLFGQWMEEYRIQFLIAGMVFMMGTFFWNIKKHKISTKKAIITHLLIMITTFAIVFISLNVFLFIVN